MTQSSGIPCSTSLSTVLKAIGQSGVASKVKTAGKNNRVSSRERVMDVVQSISHGCTSHC